MITHIVQWKVKSEAAGLNKAGILAKMKSDLEALPPSIADISSLSVGLNEKPSETASDIVLISTFADWEALDRYQAHPEHVKVGSFIKEVAVERRVVDFEQ
ncbi:Dabb family protein [Kiritimatiellota bacterium B12222]|nr:Dabb family protein [Kiritimatiellota bacterium B12222]